VVDDGSTDDTPTVLARYGGRVRVHRQPNGGIGRARNTGARLATGEYVVYLDSDDLLFPWSLAVLRDLIDRHDRPALLLGKARRFEVEGELADAVDEPPRYDVWADFLEATQKVYGFTVSGAIRRDVLLAHGGFAESRAIATEDLDFWLRIGTAPGFVYIDAPALYAYRQHTATLSRAPAKLYRGMRHLYDQERRGAFPGGEARQRERHVLLGRILHFLLKRLLREGSLLLALDLYLRGARSYRLSGDREFAARTAELFLAPPRRAVRRALRGAAAALRGASARDRGAPSGDAASSARRSGGRRR
jgi:glycosyltransferase involved in cell wall biosynthesis